MIGHGLFDVVVGVTFTKDQKGNWPIGIRIGTGGGDIVVKSEKGNSHTIKNVVSGEVIPCTLQQVVSVTGTVGDIVAFYQ